MFSFRGTYSIWNLNWIVQDVVHTQLFQCLLTHACRGGCKNAGINGLIIRETKFLTVRKECNTTPCVIYS